MLRCVVINWSAFRNGSCTYSITPAQRYRIHINNYVTRETSCDTVTSRECHRTPFMTSQHQLWFMTSCNGLIKSCCKLVPEPVLIQIIVLASHPCTCVLHRQGSQLHTLKLPKFFNFHGDFHQKWHFAYPKISFAHPALPFLAKSMIQIFFTIWCH